MKTVKILKTTQYNKTGEKIADFRAVINSLCDCIEELQQEIIKLKQQK